MRRNELWVCSSACCEKSLMRRLCKNAFRVGWKIKERACVHSFWFTYSWGCHLAFSPITFVQGRRLNSEFRWKCDHFWIQPSPGTASHNLGGLTRWCSSIQSSSMVKPYLHTNMRVILCLSQVVQKAYSDSFTVNGTDTMNSGEITLLWSFTISAFCLGGMISGSLGGFIADTFGRSVFILL